VHYEVGALAESDLAGDPLGCFLAWFAQAEAAGIAEPNAMVLSTADAHGQPSARTVLLKQADSRGFACYTNLASRKGRELQGNPQAAIVFPGSPCSATGLRGRLGSVDRPGRGSRVLR
jgi:pyridoxamine 5'-phosphate oxidase